MKFTFAHNNINVVDLQKSIDFYHKALGLELIREKEAADGSYKLAFLSDGVTEHQLELTWLQDLGKDAYDLGDNEIHMAFYVDDLEAARAMHKGMGCVCFENHEKNLYFIEDPDGYWTEIMQKK